LADDIKELGGTFPEEFELKESRMVTTTNEVKPMFKQNADLRASNARSMISVRSTGNSFRKSGLGETGQALLRPG
jgi:hypothetical protein